ncbi:MAG: protease modulator HflK N-terminal domain-containing protein, partial [Betaproteobacteria bacterium]
MPSGARSSTSRRPRTSLQLPAGVKKPPERIGSSAIQASLDPATQTGNRLHMALNDPQWGRGRGDGPPDLDELWARLNRRLAGVFGGRRGGSPGSPGQGTGGGAGLG